MVLFGGGWHVVEIEEERAASELSEFQAGTSQVWENNSTLELQNTVHAVRVAAGIGVQKCVGRDSTSSVINQSPIICDNVDG
jgi:hypothetical protein